MRALLLAIILSLAMKEINSDFYSERHRALYEKCKAIVGETEAETAHNKTLQAISTYENCFRDFFRRSVLEQDVIAAIKEKCENKQKLLKCLSESNVKLCLNTNELEVYGNFEKLVEGIVAFACSNNLANMKRAFGPENNKQIIVAELPTFSMQEFCQQMKSEETA